MLKRCCCGCFNLYAGSLLVAGFRLSHWLLILFMAVYMSWQIYSPDSGLLPFQAKMDIEANGEEKENQERERTRKARYTYDVLRLWYGKIN